MRKELIIAILLVAAVASNGFAACVIGGDPATRKLCKPLLAGQHIDTGSVCVQADDEYLVVTYVTKDGWELTETHLWVGSDLNDAPQTKKGNPIPGQFPYASGDITGQTSHTFMIPLAELAFVCPGDNAVYYIAAHAAMQKECSDGTWVTETGWGEGERFVRKGNWATYFVIELSCDCDNGGGGNGDCSNETAFAKGDTCFLDLDLDNDGSGDFNRWGWTLGPLSESEHEFEIWAAAGQCDTTKGTLVGTLNVIYTSGIVQVTYNIDPAYTLTDSHLYIGNEPLPRDVNDQYTVAPGQYPYQDGLSNYTISGLSGDIYIVAHATVDICVD